MKILLITLYFLSYLTMCLNWRAVPANQAMYFPRAEDVVDPELILLAKMRLDENLPRDSLDQIFKFGWCTRDVIQKANFRRAVNMTLPTYDDVHLDYIYLVERKHTKAHLQCIIMKAYVAEKFLFSKGRLPLYYCQGIMYILMFNTVIRYEIHEFSLDNKLNVPMNFVFEFYHPQQY